MPLASALRLAELCDRVRRQNASLRAPPDSPGLTLNLDVLQRLGAAPDLLQSWRAGFRLGVSGCRAGSVPNHPSLAQNASWAEREWNRLEGLGKVFFYPPDKPKPFHLNVNPRAYPQTEGKRPRQCPRGGTVEGTAHSRFAQGWR